MGKRSLVFVFLLYAMLFTAWRPSDVIGVTVVILTFAGILLATGKIISLLWRKMLRRPITTLLKRTLEVIFVSMFMAVPLGMMFALVFIWPFVNKNDGQHRGGVGFSRATHDERGGSYHHRGVTIH